MGITCSISPANGLMKLTEIQMKRAKRLAFLLMAVTVFVLTGPAVAGAVNPNQRALTDLFTTSAFTGSWEVFEKFNFVGYISNFLISAFCLIGLTLTVIRFTVTLLYKSNEAIFDQIYDLKGKGASTKFNFFGLPGLAKAAMDGGLATNGNFGTGADAIIGFILSLMPNIKAYSDYNPEKMAYNLKETDTITTYVLKMSIPTIMSIFFFAIGFNGTLWQIYGNVVNAMASIAERATDDALVGWVQKVANAGAYYQFNYDTSTAFGKLQSNIANSVYTKCLGKATSYDTHSMQVLGANIEAKLEDKIKIETIDQKFGEIYADGYKSIANDPEMAKHFHYTTTINTNSHDPEAPKGYAFTIALSELGMGSSADGKSGAGMSDTKGWHVHVIITRDNNADDRRFYDQITKNKGETKTESGSTDGIADGPLITPNPSK